MNLIPSLATFFSLMFGLGLFGGGKPRPRPPFVRVIVHISSPTGRPVRNAGVVINQYSDLHWREIRHPYHVEIKTDRKGVASIDGFFPGYILIQVIANGYDTTGNYYKVLAPRQNIYIRLQPPPPQITIYPKSKPKPAPPAKNPPQTHGG